MQEDPSLVAKVYHEPKPQHARKLTAMIENPPADPMAARDHTSIAWPQDLIETADHPPRFVGYLMPFVEGMQPVVDYYQPGKRRKKCPLFNYLYLHQTARNLASSVNALHMRGYVIGDVNQSNTLVNERSLVTLVDTDSFQVPNLQDGSNFRCPVGTPHFTPPELQTTTRFADVDRTPEHDRFGLAVLLFHLLMEGVHPFASTFTGGGEAPLIEDRISSGHFPYAPRTPSPDGPPPHAPPFEVLHPDLCELFVRCFVDGHDHPPERPTPQMWLRTLDRASKDLLTCLRNAEHRYGSHLKTCPWNRAGNQRQC